MKSRITNPADERLVDLFGRRSGTPNACWKVWRGHRSARGCADLDRCRVDGAVTNTSISGHGTKIITPTALAKIPMATETVIIDLDPSIPHHSGFGLGLGAAFWAGC